MTSYTVTAESMQDAIDKARWRAQDDGLVVRGVGRVFRGVIPGTWTVELSVELRR